MTDSLPKDDRPTESADINGKRGSAFSLDFSPDAFMVTPGAVVGRQSAGASMLSALVQRSDHIPFTVCVNNPEDEQSV